MDNNDIIENIIDKHMFCQWRKYDLRKFIESVVIDTLALKDMPDTFRFRHDTDWGDRNRYERD